MEMKIFNSKKMVINVCIISLRVMIYSNLLYAEATTFFSNYPIIDTGQQTCYNNSQSINVPDIGKAFYGQDAQFQGIQPDYQDNKDGTVTDLNTGLMWQQDLPEDKYIYSDCVVYADTCMLAGYSDWRLPTIKEIYSLMLFSGVTGMSEFSSVPYIDTEYFDFRFGNEVDAADRFIDSQYATSTIYHGYTMGGNETMFGLNLADGRIKGYGYTHFKTFEIKLVRGKETYGINDFIDNEDGTITDQATGLMWDQVGSTDGMNWEDALAWAQTKNAENYLRYNDWRLPNAKELHSIVDYERSPSYTNSPAIDPLFNIPEIIDEDGDVNFPWYWTSTTHYDGPSPNKAVYICFGEALGYWQNKWMDVHGAGAQRSDPKEGDSDDYPEGFGPQGDAIRILNYVRLVRDASMVSTIENNKENMILSEFALRQNYPNPFNPTTTIRFSLPVSSEITITVYNMNGQKVKTLMNTYTSAGHKEVIWNGTNEYGKNVASGIYICQLIAGSERSIMKMSLMR